MKIKKLIVLALISTFVLSILTTTQAQETMVEFSLSLDNLANPGQDHYEGWFITDDGAKSTGKFSINDAGEIVDLEGSPLSSFTTDINIDSVSTFVVTLEPNGDTDTTPASIKPVAGDLNTEKTSATLKHNIGVDFNAISGNYILATPTDNNTDANENSGIWYLNLGESGPSVGLDLPDLSATDWIYEGWVIFNGTPVTTGTFDDFNAVDNADPYSDSTANGPPFPGEDFLQSAPSGLNFPTDLAGTITALTIEPRSDNSPAPFQFHVLEDQIPSNAVDHVTYSMDDISDTLPSGMLTISGEEDGGFLPIGSFALVTLTLVVLMGTKTRFTRNRKK